MPVPDPFATVDRRCRFCRRTFAARRIQPNRGGYHVYCSDDCRHQSDREKLNAYRKRRYHALKADADAQAAARGDDPPTRFISAATGEPEFDADDVEFQKAMERYKRERNRPFPTLREVLAVLRSLGYRKVAPPTDLPGRPASAA